MTTWMSLPQAPVTSGESGHLNDHNTIQAGLSKLWGAVAQSTFNVCHPTYGADPTGVNDSTTAIQNAINACYAAGGGTVYFPAGTYLVTPVSSTSAALVLNNGTTGYVGVRLAGPGGTRAATLKRSAAGPILAMAGPSSDTSGATHCQFCALESLQLDGNTLTGTMLQLYYAGNLSFRQVRFTGCNDIVVDTAEFWDSRFWGCVWELNGSTTADTAAPNVLLRNSAASSGFGASTDTVNQIHFVGCRWETFRSGAVVVQQGVGNSNTPNGIYLVDSKMETGSVNGAGLGASGGGSHLTVDANSKFVHVSNLYCYSGGFYPGYSTARDVISFSGQNGSLANVDIASGSSSTVANGLTLNATVAGQVSQVKNVRGLYGTGTPTGAHINYGTMTGRVLVENPTTNGGSLFGGSTPLLPQVRVQNSSNTITNSAALTALQTATIPGGEPYNGSVYRMKGYGNFSVTGTPTMTFAVYWGGIAGTLLGTIPAVTAGSGIANAPFEYEVLVNFRSPTSVILKASLSVVTSTSTDAASSFLFVAGSTVTVASSSNSDFTMGFTWSAASASNTIRLFGGSCEKIA